MAGDDDANFGERGGEGRGGEGRRDFGWVAGWEAFAGAFMRYPPQFFGQPGDSIPRAPSRGDAGMANLLANPRCQAGQGDCLSGWLVLGGVKYTLH